MDPKNLKISKEGFDRWLSKIELNAASVKPYQSNINYTFAYKPATQEYIIYARASVLYQGKSFNDASAVWEYNLKKEYDEETKPRTEISVGG